MHEKFRLSNTRFIWRMKNNAECLCFVNNDCSIHLGTIICPCINRKDNRNNMLKSVLNVTPIHISISVTYQYHALFCIELC